MNEQINHIKGDLIKLALAGEFDVIAHGCNCFSTQKSGVAKQMSETFHTDKFESEVYSTYYNNISKLGNIEDYTFVLNHSKYSLKEQLDYIISDDINPAVSNEESNGEIILTVINCYTQYGFNSSVKPLDYEALTLCLRKINHLYPNKHIGLPKIGCGLAGGDWERVEQIIKNELTDCEVTIVEYEKL